MAGLFYFPDHKYDITVILITDAHHTIPQVFKIILSQNLIL